MTGTSKRHLRLAAAALLTTLLGVSWVPSLSLASGPSSPEITDASGDVNPAAFLASSDENLPAFEDQGAYDLEKAYVLIEDGTQFSLQFKVASLPDSWDEVPPQAGQVPAEGDDVQPSVTLAAYFTIKGVSYEAQAILTRSAFEMPEGVEGRVTEEELPDEEEIVEGEEGAEGEAASEEEQLFGVVDAYVLLRRNQDPLPVSGAFNAAEDTVTITIPKSEVGSPKKDDRLEDFRVEGRYADAKLDFAPDAVDYTPPAPGTPAESVVQIILNKISGQQIVEPQPGNVYTFQGAQTNPGADVRLDADVDSKTVTVGHSVTYVLHVKNAASSSDTVFLTLSTAAQGFTHRVSDEEILLDPGQEEDVIVTVTASKAATGTADSIVSAMSRMGDSALIAFHTTAKPGTSGGPSPSGTGGTDADDDSKPDGPAKKGGKSGGGRAPGFEAALMVGALFAVVALRRRL